MLFIHVSHVQNARLSQKNIENGARETCMEKAKSSRQLYPIWYQYEVRPTDKNPEKESWVGALANLIVFAYSDEDGRAKCGRHIAYNHWEIISLKRASALAKERIGSLEKVFDELYRKAEQDGIAVRFDGWRTAGSQKS